MTAIVGTLDRILRTAFGLILLYLALLSESPLSSEPQIR